MAHVGEELALGGVGRGGCGRGLAQALLHLDARGDVLDDAQVARRVLRGHLHRREGQAYPHRRAVRTQVALVQAVAVDAPGVQAAELAQALGDVVRVGERHRVGPDQLADAAADDLGEARVGLGDPARARVEQHHPQRRLLEDHPEARLGGLARLQRGALALLAVAPPHQVAGGVHQHEAERHHHAHAPGQRADAGIGLALVDLGEHQPGRALDRRGIGQHRHAAVVASAGEDAALAERRARGRQVGGGERALERERRAGLMAQRGQEAHPLAISPHQIGLGAARRHRPGLDHRIQRGLGLPAQVGHAARRHAHRREHAVVRAPLGILVQVDKLHARPPQHVGDPLRMGGQVRAADHERGRALRIDQGQPLPAAQADEFLDERLHARVRHLVAPTAVHPAGEQGLELRMAGEHHLRIHPRLGEPALDVLALLLGDDRQRALRLAADLLAQRAVAEGADAGDQHGEGDEREGEAPTGMAAARVGGIGGGDEFHGVGRATAAGAVCAGERMPALLRRGRRAATRTGPFSLHRRGRAPDRPWCD